MFERFAGAARRTVELAAEEADRLRHERVGTEHLLLGLLAQPQDPVARLLGRHGLDLAAGRQAVAQAVGGPDPERDGIALAAIGIDLDAVREAVESAFGPGALDAPAPVKRSRWSGPRFGEGARQVLVLALRAAGGQRVRRIETGHLLLGLVREGGGLGARLLRVRGVDLAELERETEALLVGGVPEAS
ncbi:Clp protease N-terminal domain-containing protein [Streptomyces sp. TLI_171]|uniref:Clp protease N-terminal domain-containing protein n=1 Tax=Streptomyces sp. TLI_171 TaxID=1938859 RepID=UPI000C18DCBA|nr:Clp protease N-terminal domain-containing protein [Streptomyces sp. TLI_171]RKE21513.1 ClpA/ClpB-like protein [Streptomyces sp. TLI_171]